MGHVFLQYSSKVLSVKKTPKSLLKMPNMTSYLVELSGKLSSENKSHLILQSQ